MPRTPSIRYYDSRKAYYTKFRGRQHLLSAGPKDEPDGPTFKRAIEVFARIMHIDEAERAEDHSCLSVIILLYYRHLEREERIGTLALTKTVLEQVILKLGKIKVRELKPFAVLNWIDEMTTWNSTTRRMAVNQLSGALNWGVERGLLTKNPIRGLKGKPESRTRGKEAVIPDPLQDLLISSAGPDFALFLRLLRGTGARPVEIANADCQHYRPEWGAIMFPWNPGQGEYRWKCGKKTKRDRMIFLTPQLQSLVEDQIVRVKGKGLIARTKRGNQWERRNLWDHLRRAAEHDQVQEWSKANDFALDSLTTYGFRHSFITRMLLAGCPIKLLADLCGTSVQMIERNYSHAHDDPVAMRRLFLQFNRPLPSGAAFLPVQPDPSLGDNKP